ncbi:unnamed protein product, partial [Vitrella brassicaformis CCMP3155]
MRCKPTVCSALLALAALIPSDCKDGRVRMVATLRQPIGASAVSSLVADEALEEKRCLVNQKKCERCGTEATGDERCELCEMGFYLSSDECKPIQRCKVSGDTAFGDAEKNDVARAGLVSSFAECHRECAMTPGCEAVSFYGNGHCVLHDHTALKTMGYKQGVQSARLDCKPIEELQGDGCRVSYCEICGEREKECLQCRSNFTRTDKGKCRYENKEEADWPDIRPPTFGSESEIIKNEVARIVSLMTIEEKIGQMTMARQKWIKPSEMKSNAVGSYLLGGDDDIGDNSAQAWARLSDRYWNATTEV